MGVDLSAEMATGTSWGAAFAATQRQRLSVAMIARDEARFLPGCLDALRAELGDAVEIVVVDTGSEDDTPNIASAYGCRVVDWAWRDDFAAARNVSIDHTTGDWVLVWDADFRPEPGFGDAVRAFMARNARQPVAARGWVHEAPALDTPVADVVAGKRGAQSWSPALLMPRSVSGAAPRFRRTIHEHPFGWLKDHGVRVEELGRCVVHYGTVPSLRGKLRRDERNRRLLERAIAADPDDIESAAYLVRDHVLAGRTDDASAVALAALARPERPDARLHFFVITRYLAEIAAAGRQWESAYQAAALALAFVSRAT